MFGGREAHGKVPRTVVVKPELLTHSMSTLASIQHAGPAGGAGSCVL